MNKQSGNKVKDPLIERERSDRPALKSMRRKAMQGSPPDAFTELRSERSALLPDMLAPGLDVIFVGAAPSHSSADIGHYYAGPTNKFWKLLHQAGFTPLQLLPEQDEEVLQYRIGLTAIYSQLSTSANHLLPIPSALLRTTLQNKLEVNAPRFVCYNGKDVYRMCTGRVCLDWGEQPECIGPARVFVVISSSARADGWGKERLALYTDLRTMIEDRSPF